MARNQGPQDEGPKPEAAGIGSACGLGASPTPDPRAPARAVPRQDSMATPGNFGGGSTGPGQIFLGITGAPPSAPGRGRAQSPVRQKPNPQATKHERQARAVRSRGFLSAIHNAQETCRFRQATSNARRPAPHVVPAGRIAPADGVMKATGTIADGVQPSKSQSL
jgi:hypothetical protein